MDVVTLLKNFAFVGGAGDEWNTDWMPWPAGYEKAQMVVAAKSRIGSSALKVQLQATWDTDQTKDVGSLITTGAPGIQIQNITADLGPMIRLTLSCAADCQVVVSVYLTPKSA